MGRIKELQSKEKLTQAEEKELNELLAEAKATDTAEPEVENADANDEEVTVPDPGDDDDEVSEEEAKAIDSMADAIATKAQEKMAGPLKEVVESLKSYTPAPGDGVVTSAPKFIVDKQMGKVSVSDLAKEKIQLPGRADKQYQEVSKATSHWLTSLLLNDKEKLQLLTEGTGAAGGFLVPEDFANVLVEDVRDQVVMRQLADVITTTSDTVHVPRLDKRPHASWRSEGAVKATSTVQFLENVLTPYSLASIVTLSKELVDDASLGVNGSIVSKVAQIMSQSIAETEDQAFWVGDGSGKPTGIDNYSFTTLTASTTDSNRADTVLSAYSRLPQGYRNRAAWVMNNRTLGSIRRVKDTNGNYLLLGIGVTPQPTLLGRPVYEQNDIGDGKAFFGDFSLYTIVDREGIQVAQTDVGTVAGYSAFERNLVHVRVEKRVDGELNLTNGIIEVTGLGAI